MKTVLIIGAGSGVGMALKEVFNKHEWETIALTHKDVEITDQKSIEEVVKKLHGKLIDVLINCAGVYDGPADGDQTATTINGITKVFQVNTIGAKILADLLVPNLLKGKERLVVTISSIMSTYSQLDEYAARHWSYGASKMALNYAMISFAKEHPEIKSVLIHPGWVKTKMGGKDALIEPKESAAGIYKLIINHESSLPNGKLIDYQGKLIEF
ncbi:MAG: short chain dehydrogenase [Parcubacteria group bacterium GW2011_GWC1_34_10]|nr:MAG: short chain dehydrogenase [Parcubacteria group bacterium GW2011_GWC1_34_10]